MEHLADDGRLYLTGEEMLTTTRSVRKRLDFDRPVSRDVLRDCVRLALQAPSGSNRWLMQFVIVTDEAQRKGLADIYRKGYEQYRTSPTYIGSVDKGTDDRNESQQRTAGSADYLAANMERAPALVLACGMGRPDAGPPVAKTTLLGSVLPGMWSFMLAAREHGLGTTWTTVMLFREQEIADLLGIPIDKVTIGAMTPVAYTKGTSFKPAMRPDPDEVIHWDRW